MGGALSVCYAHRGTYRSVLPKLHSTVSTLALMASTTSLATDPLRASAVAVSIIGFSLTQLRGAAAPPDEPTAAAPASPSTEETMSQQIGARGNDRDQQQFLNVSGAIMKTSGPEIVAMAGRISRHTSGITCADWSASQTAMAQGKAATTITSTSIPGRQKSVVRQARAGGFAESTHAFQTEL